VKIGDWCLFENESYYIIKLGNFPELVMISRNGQHQWVKSAEISLLSKESHPEYYL